MASFRDILTASGKELAGIFQKYEQDSGAQKGREKTEKVAKSLKLNSAQLVLAVGFNPNSTGLSSIPSIFGYKSMEDIINERNSIFINDIYRKINLENILTIYSIVKDFPEILRIMQYLVEHRLQSIESRIEETVNSVLIEKYKAEIKSIYLDGIAGIDFAEKRLDKIDSGFRALLNEVSTITESKLIPAGDIFFRDTILPEEKRKLLNKGLIPLELVHSRLEDESISHRERKMLLDYLEISKHNRKDKS